MLGFVIFYGFLQPHHPPPHFTAAAAASSYSNKLNFSYYSSTLGGKTGSRSCTACLLLLNDLQSQLMSGHFSNDSRRAAAENRGELFGPIGAALILCFYPRHTGNNIRCVTSYCLLFDSHCVNKPPILSNFVSFPPSGISQFGPKKRFLLIKLILPCFIAKKGRQ